MSTLSTIEGFGEAYELKLKAVGITSTSALLEKCATKKVVLHWRQNVTSLKN
jgi:DNA repair protein RadC